MSGLWGPLYGIVTSFSSVVSEHATFHVEACKVASAIVAQAFDQASDLLAENSRFTNVSNAPGAAIMRLKMKAAQQVIVQTVIRVYSISRSIFNMLKTLHCYTLQIKHWFAKNFIYLIPKKRGDIRSILLTLMLMTWALWLRLTIAPIQAGLQYITFFPAVTLSAILGGYKAGLLATALGIVLATYIFTPPYYSISISVIQTSLWSNIVFLIDGLVISFSIEAMHRNRQSHQQHLDTVKLKNLELAKYEAIIHSSDDAIIGVSLEGIMVSWNRGAESIFGYNAAEVLGHSLQILNSNKNRNKETDLLSRIHHGEKIEHYDALRRHKNGDLITLSITLSPIKDDAKNIVGASVIARNITPMKAAEAQLRIAAVTFESNHAIMITDSSVRIIRVNRAFENCTCYSQEEVLGKNPRILKSGRHDKHFYQSMFKSLLNQGLWSGEIWDRNKNGYIYPKEMSITAIKNDQGKTTHYVAIFHDISERKKAEQEIHHLAFYDALTSLPNRRLLTDRLGVALTVSARNQHYGALFFLDLDRFKLLNDKLGHQYGDLLLVEVANRLKHCVRGIDTVARFGGDEFVVLIKNISTDESTALQHAAQLAEKIRTTLACPYQIRDYLHHSSPSIGVCLFHDTEVSGEDIIKHADLAMYQAKDNGRNRVCFFDPELQRLVEQRATLESDLRNAIMFQQLYLVRS